MPKSGIITAHKHSSLHRAEIMVSESCGCFYCLEIYAPSQIVEWIDEDEVGLGRTALCPRCGVDSVIGSASGFSLSAEFLRQMHKHWFAILPDV